MARHLWGMDTGDRNSIRAGAVQDRKGGARAVARGGTSGRFGSDRTEFGVGGQAGFHDPARGLAGSFRVVRFRGRRVSGPVDSRVPRCLDGR